MKEPAVIWNNKKKAFICPDCGEVQMMPYFEDGIKYVVNADSFFYRRESNLNHKCCGCGTVLWSAINPDCLILSTDLSVDRIALQEQRPLSAESGTQPVLNRFSMTRKNQLGAASDWVKISDYGFVHRKFAYEHLNIPKLPEKYTEEIRELIKNPNMVKPVKCAYRRYPLSL